MALFIRRMTAAAATASAATLLRCKRKEEGKLNGG